MPKWAAKILKGCGWTTLFLLVVGIFFPLQHPSYVKARQISCASNEKQLGLALLQYTLDDDGLMPNISDTPGGRNTWRRAILPYHKSEGVYRCPSRDEGRQTVATVDGLHGSYAANYSGNYSGAALDKGNGAFAGPGSKPVSFIGLQTPESLISVCEVQNSGAPEFNMDDAARFGPQKQILWAGHSGGGNYLFADGHVKWMRPVTTQGLWYRDTARPLSANGLAVLKEAQARGK